jgi:hypothetical protein
MIPTDLMDTDDDQAAKGKPEYSPKNTNTNFKSPALQNTKLYLSMSGIFFH